MFRSSISLMIVMGLIVGCKQQPQQNEYENAAPETTQTEKKMNESNKTPQRQNATNEDAVATADEISEAVCQLEPVGDSGVTGTIHFTKENGSIKVQGEVDGLTPGKHGFHVHEKGDLSDKKTGKSAGGHFNPTNKPHGRPSDKQRHVGDLGNIEAGEDGKATVSMTDEVIELNGENSIVGRAIVVHAGEDKFTQPSGDAGDRVAFGVIEASE